MTNRNVKETVGDAPRRCGACGTVLAVVNPRRGGRIARFCSDRCRVAYHRGRRPRSENEPTLADTLEVLAEMRAEFPAYFRVFSHLERLAERHHKGGN